MSKPTTGSLTPSVWFLGTALSVLTLAASFLGTWWIAALLAAGGLGLTAIIALRAASIERLTGEQAQLSAQQLAQAEDERDQLHRAVDALPAPTAICGKNMALLTASASLLRLAGADRAGGKTLEALVGQAATKAAMSGSEAETEISGRSGSVAVRVRAAEASGGLRVAQFLPRDAEAAQAEQFKKREDDFRNTSKSINDLAQRLASSSELMSAYADDQAKGARKQKEQTVAVTDSIERMMNAVMEIASNASATSQAADEARDVARDGVDLVHKAVEGVGALALSAKELASVLSGLDNQAAEIGRIIGVITDIADQTNLLALNAAIEAARAGDAGRGFAVVADEVRKLAEKTMTATQEVRQSITTIQRSSKDAVASMDRTGKQVTESTDLSNQAGQALERVMAQIESMVDRVQQIAHAAEGQSAAAEDISKSVEDIAEIARDADEGATQQAYATRDIANLSADLLRVSQGIGGTKESATRLAKSDGRMKGILPKLMQDFLREEFGQDVFEAVQEEMGNPTFLPTESYPDTVLKQMAELTAAVTGKSAKQVLHGLGTQTIKGFHKLYKRYFKVKDLKAFLLSLNDLHAEVVRDMPGVKPPRFTYEDKGDVLFINYKSPRALFDYFHGILEGSAAFFGQRASVKIKPLDKETARAEVHFLECGTKTECGTRPKKK